MPHTHTVKLFSITCIAYQKHPSPHSTESYPQQERFSHPPAHVCMSCKTLVTFLLPSDFLLKNLSLSVSIQSYLSLWCLTGSIFHLFLGSALLRQSCHWFALWRMIFLNFIIGKQCSLELKINMFKQMKISFSNSVHLDFIRAFLGCILF